MLVRLMVSFQAFFLEYWYSKKFVLMGSEQSKAFKTRRRSQLMVIPLARPATRYWTLWFAPFGRARKRSSTLLHFCEGKNHSLQSAPSG